MNCPRCQHENPTGMKFCGECAAPLASTCSSCGAGNPPEHRFCGQCAAPLRTTQTAKFAAPESYTPKHLAEKILTSKSALEGERKQVTVLFADLKGSMELLADRDPEEARKLLDPVLERMMEAVHRYEGTVNQVMGDGIMALFGAPLAHEDHAVRACYAALRMQEAVKRYAEEARRTHGVNVQIRVGLNSGEVVVRAIGSDLHMDYTAVGQTTHLAARMEQFASPGSILLTPTTLSLVEGFVAVRSLGPVPVKGLADRVEVFEVTDVGLARTRLQAAAARGLTRFVGRDAEMAQLYDARALAGQGHGQVVAVVGEPGVGKSRLFYEFMHSHRTQGWLVLESGSVSYGKATPYLPLSDLLRAYFRIETSDDVRAIRAKVTGNILTLDEALNEAIPPVLWLLDALPDDSPFLALEPAERRRRTLAAVKAMLLSESRVQPVLIVFEDLHWIDSETQAFLDSFVESLPAAPILLAVNYRPEYQHAWGSKTYYRQLRIDPLPPESAEDLLTALLGTDASIASLTPLLIERTEGNPLFLEESIRTLVELGALAGSRGAFRLVKSLDAISVPPTVQSILAARIDRLGAEDKRLLQAAAVVGKDVPFALLHAIAELDEDGLRRALGRLQAAEFLYEARLFPDLEYTFKHALTHEVAYASLLQEPRRTLHARITGAIEHLYSERLAEHLERLAYHAVRGAAWERAVTYCGDAGDRVYERSAALAALGYYEQALDAIRHLPESRRTIERTVDLHVAIRTPLAQLVEYERVFNHLREAERLAVALGDNTRLARIFALLAFSKYQAGDPRGAIEYGQRALEIAAEGRDRYAENLASFFMAQAYLSLGEYGRALPLYEQAATTAAAAEKETFTGMRLPARQGVLRGWWAICLAEVGRFPEAVLRGEEAIEVANRVGDPFSRVAAHFCLGEVQLQQGDARKAIALLSRAFDMCREFNVAMYHQRILGALGHAQALLGDLVEGLTAFEAAVAWSRSKNIRFRLAFLLASYGEALLMSGRRDDALAVAHEAIEAARVQEDVANEARALRVHGEVTSRGPTPDFTAAGASYRDALRLADRLGMRPLVAHCHAGLAKLYHHAGKRTESDEHFAAATSMYREMGMTYWLEKAERELKELA